MARTTIGMGIDAGDRTAMGVYDKVLHRLVHLQAWQWCDGQAVDNLIELVRWFNPSAHNEPNSWQKYRVLIEQCPRWTSTKDRQVSVAVNHERAHWVYWGLRRAFPESLQIERVSVLRNFTKTPLPQWEAAFSGWRGKLRRNQHDERDAAWLARHAVEPLTAKAAAELAARE